MGVDAVFRGLVLKDSQWYVSSHVCASELVPSMFMFWCMVAGVIVLSSMVRVAWMVWQKVVPGTSFLLVLLQCGLLHVLSRVEWSSSVWLGDCYLVMGMQYIFRRIIACLVVLIATWVLWVIVRMYVSVSVCVGGRMYL